MLKRKALYIIVSAALLLATVFFAYDIFYHVYQPLRFASKIDYHLKPGTSVRQLAHQLYVQDIIRRPYYFEAYARLRGLDVKLQAGEYVIEPGVSTIQILALMRKGAVRQYSFTIIEGWTFKQVITALHAEKLFKHEIAVAANDNEIMALLGYRGEHPEGRFYPDTYYFARDTSEITILKRAYSKMEKILQRQWQQRSENLPIKNAYEALILASIVERESALASERSLVAAVFINRLNQGMRLQTDPTVIYGMGEQYDGDIRFRDLRHDTPYNTYTRSGLPPTPIAMPSEVAIHASLHPADSPVVYFVAKGESDGSHQFSTTLSEHNAAVARYLHKQRTKPGTSK